MIPPVRAIRLVTALIAMALLLTSCRGSAEHAAHAADPHAQHGRNAPAAAPAADFSVYELGSSWTDQEGRSLLLQELGGRARVVALVYTRCAYACPRIVSDMKRVEAELEAAGVDAGYVLVSIDPSRDSPQRLAEFAAATALDPADWTLLTGSDDSVMEIAALLGVRYRRVSDTDFEHSNVLTLLDSDGRILHREIGLGADPAGIVAAARGATR